MQWISREKKSLLNMCINVLSHFHCANNRYHERLAVLHCLKGSSVLNFIPFQNHSWTFSSTAQMLCMKFMPRAYLQQKELLKETTHFFLSFENTNLVIIMLLQVLPIFWQVSFGFLSLSSCCSVSIAAALTEVGEREVGERGHWIFGVFNIRPPLSNKKVYYI